MAGAAMVTYNPGDPVAVLQDIPVWSGGYLPAGSVFKVARVRQSQGRSRVTLLDLCTERGVTVVSGLCADRVRAARREDAE